MKLAEHTHMGLLKEVAIPTVEHEAERALMRRRGQLAEEIRACKQRICSFLLFHEVREPAGLKGWSARAVEELQQLSLAYESRAALDNLLLELKFLKTEKSGL